MNNAQSQCHVGTRANRKPCIGLACSDGQARVDDDHFCLIVHAPVIQHAKIHRTCFGLVIADINIEFGATDVVLGVDVSEMTHTLHQFECQALGQATKWFSGGDVWCAPEPGKKWHCTDNI